MVDMLIRCITGWFRLNDGKIFPGQSPRRFFESDSEILHMSPVSLYEDLSTVFRQLILFGKFGAP